jgi:predicted  nucleic acid-binding Zn-ribbon protein
MGANGNNGDFRTALDKLIANLHMQFDDIKGQFHSINERLMTIEQRGGPKEAAATAARAEREHKAIATKLEVDTKKAWRTQAAPSSSNKRRHHRHP